MVKSKLAKFKEFKAKYRLMIRITQPSGCPRLIPVVSGLQALGLAGQKVPSLKDIIPHKKSIERFEIRDLLYPYVF